MCHLSDNISLPSPPLPSLPLPSLPLPSPPLPSPPLPSPPFPSPPSPPLPSPPLPSPPLPSPQGDTSIRYFEIIDDCFFLSMYQSKEPQRGVGCMPKRQLDYMQCEVWRFYKVTPTTRATGFVEPISMKVPRKVGIEWNYMCTTSSVGIMSFYLH